MTHAPRVPWWDKTGEAAHPALPVASVYLSNSCFSLYIDISGLLRATSYLPSPRAECISLDQRMLQTLDTAEQCEWEEQENPSLCILEILLAEERDKSSRPPGRKEGRLWTLPVSGACLPLRSVLSSEQTVIQGGYRGILAHSPQRDSSHAQAGTLS